jgi:hypothetical protein
MNWKAQPGWSTGPICSCACTKNHFKKTFNVPVGCCYHTHAMLFKKVRNTAATAAILSIADFSTAAIFRIADSRGNCWCWGKYFSDWNCSWPTHENLAKSTFPLPDFFWKLLEWCK